VQPGEMSTDERHRREVLFLRLYILTVVLAVVLFILGIARGRPGLAVAVFAIIVIPNGIIGLAIRRRREQERPFG
jgi:hypothetical protein